MTVAGLVPVLEAAMEGRYGVLAINVVNGLTLRSVVNAAEQLRAPVIVQTSVKTVLAQGVPETISMFHHAAERATVPVVLHLDHCTDRNVLRDCLEAGWSSVLFDCSGITLDDATEQTKQVVAEARVFGAHVEGEIEGIKGVEDGVGSDEDSQLYALEDAVHFVRQTGIHCFAPAIGNAHGAYPQLPELDVARVDALVSATGLPMALHGGSGLSDDQFRDLIGRGCVKVNISTALKHAYIDAHREFLTVNPGCREPLTLMASVSDSVSQVAQSLIKVFGSEGSVA
ncbi:MAG: class II fructose-bisphosphate aldolase [Nocardioidaceae bacterium]